MEEVRYFKLKEDAYGYAEYEAGEVYDFNFCAPHSSNTVADLVTDYPEDWCECDKWGHPVTAVLRAPELRGALSPLFVVVELLKLIPEASDAEKALVQMAIKTAKEIDLDRIKNLLNEN